MNRNTLGTIILIIGILLIIYSIYQQRKDKSQNESEAEYRRRIESKTYTLITGAGGLISGVGIGILAKLDLHK